MFLKQSIDPLYISAFPIDAFIYLHFLTVSRGYSNTTETTVASVDAENTLMKLAISFECPLILLSSYD